jgi:hypothetical protein
VKHVATALLIALPVLAVGESDAERRPVEDLRVLLVSAIDSPTGRAGGRLTGPMASLITERFRAAGPILVDVSTERRYRQPGCSRLQVRFSQDGVTLPESAQPETMTLDIGLNYCRDGLPPKSLS